MSSVLLRNATILVPRGAGDDRVFPLKHHSLLIEGNKITQISLEINPPSPSTIVIECTAKILCPGFIDTHHHLWQTPQKGRHTNQTLPEYMAPGMLASRSYSVQDIFWGELGGCLEALEAGTTTVVDHAHMTYTPDHCTSALAATVSSGIRSVYCYTPSPRVRQWKPTIELEKPPITEWALPQLQKLCESGPFGEGRVTMGFGFDLFYLPKEVVTDVFHKVRDYGVNIITSHYVPGPLQGERSTVDLLETYGLLHRDILLSHANLLTDSDAEKLKPVKGAISTTPETELQMGHGWPVCFQDNVKSICSLGVDCHSNNSSSIPVQLRLGLQAERARRNGQILESGKAPGKITVDAHDAFQLATIQGARAIHMDHLVGSLEVGKLADIVIFDTLTPAMVCAAEEDPIGAIIAHSAPSDIDAVIVDGQLRKQNGRLESVKFDMSLSPDLKPSKPVMAWREIALELVAARERVLAADKASGADDLEAKLEECVNLFRFNFDRLVL